MTSGAAAARYARALFDVARQEQSDLEALNRQLADFTRVVTSNQTLERALTNPAVPVGKKRGVVDALLGRAPDMPLPLVKTIRMLVDRDRLGLLSQIAAAFDARLMDYRRVVRAEVVTAMELPADRVASLKDGLARATGRDVQLQTRVDPSILGGVKIRVGDRQYDATVKTRIENIRNQILTSSSHEIQSRRDRFSSAN